jgi:hypothetical protein
MATGLRRGGLAALTKSSFDLDAEDPAIIVKAGAKNKYKAERRVPLKATTVLWLKAHLQNKMPEAPAFRVPPKQHSAKMVKTDLDAAREAWLKESPTPDVLAEREKSDFLKYEDSAHRFLDFHAFRHTRGVWLFEHHKAHPREVQDLMGVSSLALVDRYTRSYRLTDLSVIERGPDLSPPQPVESVQKTGTDGQVAPNTLPLSLPPKDGFRQNSADVGGLKGMPSEQNQPKEKARENRAFPANSERRGGDLISRFLEFRLICAILGLNPLQTSS